MRQSRQANGAKALPWHQKLKQPMDGSELEKKFDFTWQIILRSIENDLANHYNSEHNNEHLKILSVN